MAHAYYHARSSMRRFGGVTEDYLEAHEFMDHTKAHLADCRHRLLLHNSWGIFLVEKIFGTTFTRLSDHKMMPLRPILEQHITEDFGFIPTLAYCLHDLPAIALVLTDDDDRAHSQHSVSLFGGEWTDYLPIHQSLNTCREVLADKRHQRPLHNAWGISILLRLHGNTLTRPSDNTILALRPILEEHVRRDIGHIPALQESLEEIPISPWMYQAARPLSQSDQKSSVITNL